MVLSGAPNRTNGANGTNAVAIPVPMSAQAYLFSISRVTAAADLHALSAEFMADEGLDLAEKYELQQAINLRFGQLNLQAAGSIKPRWAA
jgi:hypothetical protein